jgi:hypothetical protein
MPDLHLVPECHAETVLARAFRQPSDFLNHATGIPEVARILSKHEVPNFTRVGFIDNDKKNVPRYFDNFTLLSESEGVVFKKHKVLNDYLIRVSPAIERFLLDQLTEINKVPADFNLPNNFTEFRHTLKKQKIEHNSGFNDLIQELIFKKTKGIQFIHDCISQLRLN